MKSAYPYIHRHPTTGVTELDNGMTLRDWFAGMALQGLMPNTFKTPPDDYPDGSLAELWAGMAYEMADAMMKERENKYE